MRLHTRPPALRTQQRAQPRATPSALGAVHPRGGFLRESSVTSGKPTARTPQHALTPGESQQQQRAEESLRIPEGPRRGSSPSSVCKAFAKPPAIIPLVLAGWGVCARGCVHGIFHLPAAPCSRRSREMQALRDSSSTKLPRKQPHGTRKNKSDY